MRVSEDALIEAAKALMSRTLHISSAQSLCGNCGKNVNWGEFTPICEHCRQQWLFVVSGFWVSGWEEAHYKQQCEAIAPGLTYIPGNHIGSLVPRPDYLIQEWTVGA